MNTQTSPTDSGVPPAFLNRCGDSIAGVLSGFDRLRLRGTLRHLFQPTVMEAYLNACRILIKDFGTFAQGLTARIKAAAYASAEHAGRPFRYLPSSQLSKEALARQIAREDGVTSGLIAIFSALENCLSYSVRGDRQTKHIHLVLEPRRCLHLYHYFLHEELGLCHVRVQTWFPFTVDICLNGRDRLARQMDAAGLAYRQRDNCFVWVENALRAQALLDQQLRTDWPRVLGRLLDQAHPLHQEICRPIAQTYYWTASASEYATDLIFRDAPRLAALYPRLVHHGLRTFASPDVMRFLGRNIPTTRGHVNPKFTGEVISDLKHRPEGIRVKHSVNGNSVSHVVPGEEAPSRATWIVQPGDVITSTVRPIRCLTGLIEPEQAANICSSGFAVLTPKGIPGELLFAYLRLPVICELMDLHTTASMYPAISTTDLMRLPFLLPDDATIKKVKQQITAARTARREAHALLEKAKQAVEIAIEKNEAAGMAGLRS